MEAMCHTLRGRKSKSLDKIKKESKWGRDMWQGERWEEISHLNQVGTIRSERRKNDGKKNKEKKRKKNERGVRSSTFSLRFTEIEPSVFIGVGGKIHLRDESFA